MNIKDFRYDGSKKFNIKEFDTNQTGEFKDREDAESNRDDHILELQGLQDRLYAENKEGLLVIFQAMDAAGASTTSKCRPRKKWTTIICGVR